MRIEKVNDNQIRCTLTKEDLADRQLKLSELAYGTEKAKSLFRDMMQQAAYEFGFEAENIPLMIEAIPLSTDTIILIITKVEYPEELDTRFSQFSPGSEDDSSDDDSLEPLEAPLLEGADDILGLFRKIRETKEQAEIDAGSSKNTSSTEKPETGKSAVPAEPADLAKLFVFDRLDEVTKLSKVLFGFYNGMNELYHNDKDQKYYLFIHKSDHTPEEFNKVCNILSEYSKQERYTPARSAFYAEHYRTILSPSALQVLGNL
ncbi:MAG: adaptor protein MecA [Lachnospiraceae bacterium]